MTTLTDRPLSYFNLKQTVANVCIIDIQKDGQSVSTSSESVSSDRLVEPIVSRAQLPIRMVHSVLIASNISLSQKNIHHVRRQGLKMTETMSGNNLLDV